MLINSVVRIYIHGNVWFICSLFALSAVHSVTLNLANKFSQCTFSITEHYDLFSGLIILRQA